MLGFWNKKSIRRLISTMQVFGTQIATRSDWRHHVAAVGGALLGTPRLRDPTQPHFLLSTEDTTMRTITPFATTVTLSLSLSLAACSAAAPTSSYRGSP
ncbi:hypothetical protein [Microbacterium lacticum]